MKLLPFFLSLLILWNGCYTEASLTNEQPAPDDTKVYFYLHDGSYIKSIAKAHHRIEGGYQVSGTKTVKRKFTEKFEGVLQDGEIESIGAEEFNLWGTVGIVAGVAFIVGGLYAASKNPPIGSIDW